jgi:hypothetical protein
MSGTTVAAGAGLPGRVDLPRSRKTPALDRPSGYSTDVRRLENGRACHKFPGCSINEQNETNQLVESISEWCGGCGTRPKNFQPIHGHG